MKDRKLKAHHIVPILIIAVVVFSYFFEWKIGSYIHKDHTAYNVDELSALIMEDIQEGHKNGVFYISGISDDELSDINVHICSIYGSVDSFNILTSSKGGRRVRFVYKLSDNYYVVRKYLYHESIPKNRMAAQKLYDKTVEVLDKIIIPGMTDYEKELAIHDYIVKNCEYGYADGMDEYSYSSYGVLINKKAVCNGYAEAMALLLTCSGVENKIVTGEAGGELHAWNSVKIDGKWYQADATWNDPVPDRGNYVSHMYFNITNELMDDTHVWEESLFPICDDMTYNYYEMNGFVCDYSGFVDIVKNAASKNITGTVEVLVTDYSESKYNMDFLREIPGITSYGLSVEDLGEYKQVVLFLNQGK